MKTFTLILFIQLSFFSAFAQMNAVNNNETTIDVFLFNGKTDLSKYAGSPYIDPIFKPAKINNWKDTYLVRYNAYLDQMEVQTSEGKTATLKNSLTSYRIIFQGDDQKIYESIRYGDGKIGYVQPIWKGAQKQILFIKEKIQLNPPRKAVNNYQTSTPPTFARKKDQFFYRIDKQSRPKALSNKQDVFDLFPDQDVKSFVKKEKLNLRKIEDIAKVFEEFSE